MNRPTIALCCILKDEVKNLPQLLSSVKDCFDEIHLTDTGSTDGSVEWIYEQDNLFHETGSNICNAPIFLSYFPWIKDFASARNFSMKVFNEKSEIKTDYVMWMDLDDVLSDREKFIEWRDNSLQFADFWFATYNYAFNDKKQPVCQFARERVIRTNKKFQWEYKIHEGMILKEKVPSQFTNYWTIDHKRTDEDYRKDFDRNVSMLEEMAKEGELPIRLKFYYGKELHDKGQFNEAIPWLLEIIDKPEMELHDRILSYEYLVRCLMLKYQSQEEKDLTLVAQAFSFAMNGVTIATQRAELWCMVADCLLLMSRESEARVFYESAKNCQMVNSNTHASALFSNTAAYTYIPRNQIARIKYNQGDLDGAIREAEECFRLYGHHETKEFLTQLLNMKDKHQKLVSQEKVETNEIVFSCLQNMHPYPFDEEIYKSKAMGGSETALIEVAKWMKKKTGKPVIVFNTREGRKTCESGVEYRPSQEMHSYFSNFKPEVHVAWRHNVKLTEAKTYLWSHDLFTPGGEMHSHYEKVIALSEFHKNLLKINQGIPEHKIIVSKNGLEPSRYQHVNEYKKDENKIVWVSSPDRGLESAIDIIKIAREKSGRDLKLHIFYGIENLRKYGMTELADLIDQKMEENKDFIVYHGATEQKLLAKHQMEASVWLYPTKFLETFCISAIEAISAKCYPLVKYVGALPYTLKEPIEKGMAQSIYKNAETLEEKEFWAQELIKVLDNKLWEKIDPKEFDFSWSKVTDHFLDFMDISPENYSGTTPETLSDDFLLTL